MVIKNLTIVWRYSVLIKQILSVSRSSLLFNQHLSSSKKSEKQTRRRESHIYIPMTRVYGLIWFRWGPPSWKEVHPYSVWSLSLHYTGPTPFKIHQQQRQITSCGHIILSMSLTSNLITITWNFLVCMKFSHSYVWLTGYNYFKYVFINTPS